MPFLIIPNYRFFLNRDKVVYGPSHTQEMSRS